MQTSTAWQDRNLLFPDPSIATPS